MGGRSTTALPPEVIKAGAIRRAVSDEELAEKQLEAARRRRREAEKRDLDSYKREGEETIRRARVWGR